MIDGRGRVSILAAHRMYPRSVMGREVQSAHRNRAGYVTAECYVTAESRNVGECSLVGAVGWMAPTRKLWARHEPEGLEGRMRDALRRATSSSGAAADSEALRGGRLEDRKTAARLTDASALLRAYMEEEDSAAGLLPVTTRNLWATSIPLPDLEAS